MVNVIKKGLDEKVLLSIQSQFHKTLLTLKNTKVGSNCLNELLTESEQLLLAKRLAIVFMLEKHIPWVHIQETLKVTPATIAKVKRSKENGNLKTISTLTRKKETSNAFWKDIEVLMHAGIMPVYGRHGALMHASLRKE